MDTQMSNTSKRELWIDILRGVCILLVVLGHTSPPFIKIIYGFHIALFFCLSGYLYRKKGEKFSVFLKRTFIRCIIPYFVLSIINLFFDWILHYLRHKPFPIKTFVIGILYSRGTSQWLPNCSPLWYLTTIFVALLLFELVQRMRSAKSKVAVIIAMGVCSALLSYFEVFKLPWNIDTAMMATGFIGLGYYGKKKNALQRFSSQTLAVKIAELIVLTAIGFSAIILNPIRLVSFDSNRYGNVVLMYIGALSISFVFFYLFYRIPWKGKLASYLSYLGKHTVFILGFDSFAGGIANSILGKLGIGDIADWALAFLIKLILLTIGCMVWGVIVKRIKNESIKNALSF